MQISKAKKSIFLLKKQFFSENCHQKILDPIKILQKQLAWNIPVAAAETVEKAGKNKKIKKVLFLLKKSGFLFEKMHLRVYIPLCLFYR